MVTIPKDIANDFKDVYAEIFRAGFTMKNNLPKLQSKLSELCRNKQWKPFKIDEIF